MFDVSMRYGIFCLNKGCCSQILRVCGYFGTSKLAFSSVQVLPYNFVAIKNCRRLLRSSHMSSIIRDSDCRRTEQYDVFTMLIDHHSCQILHLVKKLTAGRLSQKRKLICQFAIVAVVVGLGIEFYSFNNQCQGGEPYGCLTSKFKVSNPRLGEFCPRQ